MITTRFCDITETIAHKGIQFTYHIASASRVNRTIPWNNCSCENRWHHRREPAHRSFIRDICELPREGTELGSYRSYRELRAWLELPELDIVEFEPGQFVLHGKGFFVDLNYKARAGKSQNVQVYVGPNWLSSYGPKPQ
jgi:hypothetical protein